MDALLQDLRYGVRSLLRAPGMTFTALVTLALGIGANTALFSLISSVYLRPPPAVGSPDDLHWVTEVTTEAGRATPLGINYPVVEELRRRTDLIDGITAFMSAAVSFAAGTEPEHVLAEVVTGNYFSVLHVQPVLGRGFTPDEDAVAGASPVTVLGYDLWQNRFGGSPDVIGRTVRINGGPFTVVGVAPAGFRGLRDMERPADLWVPVMMHPVVLRGYDEPLGVDLGIRKFFAVARLSPGVPPSRVEEVMTGLMSGMADAHPYAYADSYARLDPFRGVAGPLQARQAREIIAFASAITLIILLIACGNVANLLLAQAASRRRELAVRAALGGSRSRLVRQLLVESTLLALLGGAAALVAASWMVELFVALTPVPFPVPVAIDRGTLLATLLLALGTGVLVGLSPALRSSRPDLTADLKGIAGRAAGRIRPHTTLVAGQLALSCVLLIGAALIVRTMWGIVSVDRAQPARDQVLALTVELAPRGYDGAAAATVKDRILDNARAIPGVESATGVAYLPYDLILGDRVHTESASRPGGSREGGRARIHFVRPDFFKTLRVPMVAGRDFGRQDTEGSPSVVLVNETAASRLWPGEDPLGQRLRVGADTAAWSTVVGVVADARYDEGERRDAEPAVYRSELQRTPFSGRFTLLARTRGDALALRSPLTAAVHAVDGDVPVHRIRTLGEIIDERWAEGWIAGGLMVCVGALALFLALIGLHGVVAYTVERRTREVGIRISLGASRAQILGLFGREVVRFAGAGVAVGLLLASGFAVVLRSSMPSLQPVAPLTFCLVGATLLLVTVGASLLPARRATRIDPMLALRSE